MTIPLESNLRGDRVVKRVPKEASGWMMGFPPGWVELVLMADGEIIFASLTPECVAIPPSALNATISTPELSCYA